MLVSLPDDIRFLITLPHECHYLPGRSATLLVVDPTAPMTHDVFSRLVGSGFRRSGVHLYRPICRECSECRPLRVPVRDFRPNRNQRRIRQHNADLEVTIVSPPMNQTHFALFSRYIRRRHADGSMFPPAMEDLYSMTGPAWARTQILEFRLVHHLVAVAVIDEVTDGLSAVYSFFEPDLARRSLGKFTILWQLEQGPRANELYFYLGFAIRNCPKMSYKEEFLPHEILRDNEWFPVRR
ncbi:MAG: arginyltransferase [Acidobacteria bacterium]|nr:arginyltransferase [Acidobacteriota bacterium]